MTQQRVFRNDISIVLCGEAGQGVQTVERLLTRFLKECGHHFFSTKEYMSRVRGGSNSTSIRVSSQPVNAFVDRIDVFVPLSEAAYRHAASRLSTDTVVVGDCELLGSVCEQEIVDVPFTAIAKEIGGVIYANTVAVGIIAGLMELDRDIIDTCVRALFASKSGAIVSNNLQALDRGYQESRKLVDQGIVEAEIARHDEVTGHIAVRGAQAVGMGAIAAGCDFISSYPMSPSTGVLVYLASQAHDFGIVAEQAEDEISAINMALGASYAGARAMVTTSGGGFALMTEGVSLAGIIETPIVIHLAQRPGPATGLPTRTEQGDLNLALYAGHGEFPRAIFAPGSLEDAFMLTRRAFDIADRFQVPAFVLTDQYLMDTYYDTPPFDPGNEPPGRHIVETGGDYARYAVTDDGVSPRGVPGYGQGLVCVDSDEHDESGHITESMDVRIIMHEKRLRKEKLLIEEALPPVLDGNPDGRMLVVSWGTTGPVIAEAIERLNTGDIALLSFPQVYPLHPETASFFENAELVVVVENNATGQFAGLLRLYADVEADALITKYDGLPFSVEELVEQLGELYSDLEEEWDADDDDEMPEDDDESDDEECDDDDDDIQPEED